MASHVDPEVSSPIYCPACGAANPRQAIECFACQRPLATPAAGNGAKTNPLTGLLLPDIIMYQRYRILEVISSGEVWTLYKAEDIQFGNRVVALKEIGKNNAETQEALALIEESRREMMSLASLVHPNLPRIYDYFVENHRWYFVMDFLEGDTLEAYLSKRKQQPLSIEEVLDSAIQLSTALEYLHQHQPPLGFNDLSLSDIWRTPDGKLYLVDGRVVSPAASLPGNSSVFYTLGVILRQLQADQPSAPSRRRFVLPRLRKRSKPVKHPKHPQSAPLETLIGQMTDRDVSKRPFNMRVVRQELQLIATQQAPPVSASAKKRTFSHRISRRTLLRLGGVFTLAGLASAASSWLTWHIAGSSVMRQVPHPAYSPNIGGTIYTYVDNGGYAGPGVLSAAWSPDGTRIALGSWDGQVVAWDANTGRHAINYNGPSQRVETVIWLPDGKSIAAAEDEGFVWLWDARTGNLQYTHGYGNAVISIACSPDGRCIASGGQDQTVQVWEVATGHTIVTYRRHAGGIGSVAWSPNGRYIASASFDKTVQIWEAATGNQIFTYTRHSGAVYAVAWSPDGQRIASGGKDRTVQVWPITLFEGHGQQQKPSIITYRGHTAAVQNVAWSPDSGTIASAAENVQLWNALTGQYIFTYTGNDISAVQQVLALAWSPNGRYIASGGMEGTLQVWNAR